MSAATPPHDIDAEQALIGAALLDPSVPERVAIEASDFYRPAHEIMWATIVRLDGAQPDRAMALLAALRASGNLKRVGGGPYIHTCIEAGAITAAAGQYAEIVRRAARQRRALQAVDRARQRIASADLDDLTGALYEAMVDLEQCTADGASTGGHTGSAQHFAFITGEDFLLAPDPRPDPIWGDRTEVLWSPGEPMICTGPIGVGKTTIFGHLVRGRLGLHPQLLGYRILPGQRRVLYLACDRPRQIRRNLHRILGADVAEALRDQLRVWVGPLPSDLAKQPSLLLDMCRKADADTVFVDGLKDVALELSKDDVGAGLNQAFQRCVAEGIEVAANHHQRKAANGGAKPRSIADLYGSVWIGAGAGTVILVWAERPGAAAIEVSTLKPSHEHVGPLSVLHDLDVGTLVVRDALTVEDILQTATEPLSLTDILSQLGRDPSDENERERVRRLLRRLESEGVADSVEVPRPTGGKPERKYFWRAG
jgi:replicative DNA helicase